MPDKILNTKWPDMSIDTDKIILDWKNPRIDANEKSTQDDIRALLMTSFQIEALADSLIKSKGNMAGERIIVVEENGKYVVLEGNRRTCACQLILNTGLLPAHYKGRFPTTSDKPVVKSLSQLDAVVAPSRIAAEPIITRRHTAPGILQWSPMAKQRRIVNMVAEGQSVPEISTKLQMSEASILKTLKEYHLLKYVKDLPGWTQSEKAKLDSPQLKPNAYIRFFTLKDVKKQIGLKYNPKGEIETSDGSRDVFDKAMAALARELLLPNPATGEPHSNTRSTPGEVFQAAFSSDPQLKTLIHPNSGAAIKRGKTKVKADKFFESLLCQIQDNRLLRVTDEIRRIDHVSLPTAATFLLRALLESTINWCIQNYKLGKDLEAYYVKHRYGGKHPKGGIHDPELDAKIKFLLTKEQDVFNTRGATKALNHWISTNRYSNLVIHGKWADANAATLETEASVIRPFIVSILNKSVLK